MLGERLGAGLVCLNEDGGWGAVWESRHRCRVIRKPCFPGRRRRSSEPGNQCSSPLNGLHSAHTRLRACVRVRLPNCHEASALLIYCMLASRHERCRGTNPERTQPPSTMSSFEHLGAH